MNFLEICGNPELACCRAAKQLERLQSENGRLRKERNDAVKIIETIYERTRPGGVHGGYPYGATTCLGIDVYNSIKEWRGLK